MRLIASLQHYLATVAGDTLFLHQFSGATLAAPLAGGELAVQVDTDYPWSGAIEIQVTSAPPEPAGLALRVPAWAASPAFCSTASPCRPTPPVRGTWWWTGSGGPATCSATSWTPRPG